MEKRTHGDCAVSKLRYILVLDVQFLAAWTCTGWSPIPIETSRVAAHCK